MYLWPAKRRCGGRACQIALPVLGKIAVLDRGVRCAAQAAPLLLISSSKFFRNIRWVETSTQLRSLSTVRRHASFLACSPQHHSNFKAPTLQPQAARLSHKPCLGDGWNVHKLS